MRNRATKNGLEATVISGTYVALLSIKIIDKKKVNKKNFLGFAIKRDDLTEKESYFLRGFKYFPETESDSTSASIWLSSRLYNSIFASSG